MAEVLFFTAAQQRDVLGHAIMLATHGTWTHVSVTDGGIVIEAVPPRIHILANQAAADARAGAGACYQVVPADVGAGARAWQWLRAQVGQGYSYGTIVTDLLANTLGLRSTVKLPGSRVCSSLVAMYLLMAGDGRLAYNRDPEGYTPADLGQVLLGFRTPAPGGLRLQG